MKYLHKIIFKNILKIIIYLLFFKDIKYLDLWCSCSRIIERRTTTRRTFNRDDEEGILLTETLENTKDTSIDKTNIGENDQEEDDENAMNII